MDAAILRQLRRTAVHEAAHVATASALGFTPLDASIMWDARAGGVTDFQAPGITGAAAPIVVTAGDLAADLVEHQGWPGPSSSVGPWFERHQEARARRPAVVQARELNAARAAARRGGYSDGDLLQLTTIHRHPVDVKARAARSRIQARAILAERWGRVLQISDALLEHGRVEFTNNGRTSATGARPPAQPFRVSGSPASVRPFHAGGHRRQAREADGSTRWSHRRGTGPYRWSGEAPPPQKKG